MNQKAPVLASIAALVIMALIVGSNYCLSGSEDAPQAGVNITATRGNNIPIIGTTDYLRGNYLKGDMSIRRSGDTEWMTYFPEIQGIPTYIEEGDYLRTAE
ncbi:MAG: hypothetical protein KAU14_01835, partial [Thermoplasmata archaeon]|nr:hypothetical protein [Thermoplasmata archaeon]